MSYISNIRFYFINAPAIYLTAKEFYARNAIEFTVDKAIILLTHCVLVTTYGNINLDQYKIRLMTCCWQHQAITCTNVDPSSKVFYNITLRAISQQVFVNLIWNLKIISICPTEQWNNLESISWFTGPSMLYCYMQSDGEGAILILIVKVTESNYLTLQSAFCQVRWRPRSEPGPLLNTNTVLSVVVISILKVRRSHDRLIFIIGIHILVRRHICVEKGPAPDRLSICPPYYKSIGILQGSADIKFVHFNTIRKSWGQGGENHAAGSSAY